MKEQRRNPEKEKAREGYVKVNTSNAVTKPYTQEAVKFQPPYLNSVVVAELALVEGQHYS